MSRKFGLKAGINGAPLVVATLERPHVIKHGHDTNDFAENPSILAEDHVNGTSPREQTNDFQVFGIGVMKGGDERNLVPRAFSTSDRKRPWERGW